MKIVLLNVFYTLSRFQCGPIVPGTLPCVPCVLPPCVLHVCNVCVHMTCEMFYVCMYVYLYQIRKCRESVLVYIFTFYRRQNIKKCSCMCCARVVCMYI